MTTTTSTASPISPSSPSDPPPSWRDRRPSWGGPGAAPSPSRSPSSRCSPSPCRSGSRASAAAPRRAAESPAAGGAPGLSSATPARQRARRPGRGPGGERLRRTRPRCARRRRTGSKTGSATVTSDAAAADGRDDEDRPHGVDRPGGHRPRGRCRARSHHRLRSRRHRAQRERRDRGRPGRRRHVGERAGGLPQSDGGVARYGPEGSWPSVGLHQARLTLSVPAEKLDSVLTQLSALGTVSYRSAQAQDVTATYVDTQARIDPARDSITRVRALMAKATDLQQLLVLESELTRRQSDLDALTQQLADLEQRTTMSEVTATMWTPAAATVVEGSGVVGWSQCRVGGPAGLAHPRAHGPCGPAALAAPARPHRVHRPPGDAAPPRGRRPHLAIGHLPSLGRPYPRAERRPTERGDMPGHPVDVVVDELVRAAVRVAPALEEPLRQLASRRPAARLARPGRRRHRPLADRGRGGGRRRVRPAVAAARSRGPARRRRPADGAARGLGGRGRHRSRDDAAGDLDGLAGLSRRAKALCELAALAVPTLLQWQAMLPPNNPWSGAHSPAVVASRSPSPARRSSRRPAASTRGRHSSPASGWPTSTGGPVGASRH